MNLRPTVSPHLPRVFNVKDYGAKGDGKSLSNAYMNSGSAVLNCDTAGTFTAADVGKAVAVRDALGSGTTGSGTITAFTDSQHVTVSFTATNTTGYTGVHYGTNDRNAIQAAINDAYAAGGGIVFFPAGVYQVEGLQHTGANQYNSVLEIPYTRLDAGNILPVGTKPDLGHAIELVGEFWAPDGTFYIATSYEPRNGVVIRSSGTDGAANSAYYPSVIAGGPYNNVESPAGADGYDANTSFTPFAIDKIKISVGCDDYPRLCGLQWDKGGPLRIGHLDIGVDMPRRAMNGMQYPQYTWTTGLITPGLDNHAVIDINTVMVQGFYTGVAINEHTAIRNLRVFACHDGIHYVAGMHGSWIGKALIQWCVTSVSGQLDARDRQGVTQHWGDISTLDIEHRTPTDLFDVVWAVQDTDWYDPSGKLNIRAKARATIGSSQDNLIISRGTAADLVDVNVRTPNIIGRPVNFKIYHANDTIVTGGALTTWTNGEYYQSTLANGDTFSLQFAGEGGGYVLTVNGSTGADCGMIDWYLDGNFIFPGQDWYSAAYTQGVSKSLYFACPPGLHTLKAVVNGKNASSTGYRIPLNYFTLACTPLQVHSAYGFDVNTAGNTTGLLLENLAPEFGGSWVKASGFASGSVASTIRATIRGNAAANTYYWNTVMPRSADCDVFADLYVASVTGSCGIFLRGTTDGRNLYLFDAETSGKFDIFAVVAGGTVASWTTHTNTFTAGQWYRLHAKIRGTTLTYEVNGTAIYTVTDTNLAGPGVAGVFFNSSQTDSTGLQMKNIVIASAP